MLSEVPDLILPLATCLNLISGASALSAFITSQETDKLRKAQADLAIAREELLKAKLEIKQLLNARVKKFAYVFDYPIDIESGRLDRAQLRELRRQFKQHKIIEEGSGYDADQESNLSSEID
ncbi:hypothetical protein H0H93_011650, partial [Arthromyces matolae]